MHSTRTAPSSPKAACSPTIRSTPTWSSSGKRSTPGSISRPRSSTRCTTRCDRLTPCDQERAHMGPFFLLTQRCQEHATSVAALTSGAAMLASSSQAQIRHIYEKWHETVTARDLEGVLALYAEDATMETPAILALVDDSQD